MRFPAVLLILARLPLARGANDDSGPVKAPTSCEVCKYLAVELNERLRETGKSKEVLEAGQGLGGTRKFRYQTSELRLTETLHEPHICNRILKYNIHAEKKGSLRYTKGQSETMQTLHGLVNKGVKVDLGIPYELWDQPSVEITQMQRKCFQLVEEYEDDIEEWYHHHQHENLLNYLCKNRILKNKDTDCLYEKHPMEKIKNEGKQLKGEMGGDKNYLKTKMEL